MLTTNIIDNFEGKLSSVWKGDIDRFYITKNSNFEGGYCGNLDGNNKNEFEIYAPTNSTKPYKLKFYIHRENKWGKPHFYFYDSNSNRNGISVTSKGLSFLNSNSKNIFNDGTTGPYFIELIFDWKTSKVEIYCDNIFQCVCEFDVEDINYIALNNGKGLDSNFGYIVEEYEEKKEESVEVETDIEEDEITNIEKETVLTSESSIKEDADISLVEETQSDWEEGSLTDTVVENDNLKLDSEEFIESFTDTGSHTWEVPDGVEKVDVLVVAGGGGGAPGCASEDYHGGGGAGGLILKENHSVTEGDNISLKVGSGGSGGKGDDETDEGENGEDSEFDNLIAIGGGGGNTGDTHTGGHDGGSGGGGGAGWQDNPGGKGVQPDQSGDSGTYGYGNDGGNGIHREVGGGGGGAESAGSNDKAGDGKDCSSIFGTEYGNDGVFSAGGVPGGDSNKSDNTGDGGDSGTSDNDGGDGGSGIVLIRYKTGTSGTRTSPQLDLSSLKKVKDTLIEWDSDEPTDTSITIETRHSLDNGDSWSDWEEATNGDPIPGLEEGTNVSNGLLECKQTLETSDTETSPELQNLGIYLVKKLLGKSFFMFGF